MLLIVSLGTMRPGISILGLQTTPTDALFLILCYMCVVALASGKLKLSYHPIYKYMFAFGAAMAISALLSISANYSLLKLTGVLYLIGLSVVTIYVVNSFDLLRNVVLAWITASTIVCAMGVITIVMFYVDRSSPWNDVFLHHYGSLPVGNYPRIQSTFLYPAMLCNYLTVGILMLFAAIQAGWIRFRTGLWLLGLHSFAALFTLTPGLGGLVFASAAWVALAPATRRTPSASRVLMAAGGVVFVASLAAASVSLWPISTSPFSWEVAGIRIDPTQRLLVWRDALSTFFQYPIFGKGVGLGVASVRFQAPSGQMQLLTDAHNVFLSVAAQAGLFGIACFTALVGSAVRSGFRSEPNGSEASSIRKALSIAFVSGLILQGLVGSFEDARHLWVLLGLIIASTKIEPAATVAAV